jgi:hypothetical protein
MIPTMEFDWRARTIITKLQEGCTIMEAAKVAGITKQAILKRRNASPAFAQAVAAERETGSSERRYRAWLRHPFRGKRPPTGSCHGGKPAFRYGRR